MMKLDIGNMMMIFGLAACVFFLFDLFWLGVVAKELYARYFGQLLREHVNWTAAILFYAIYIGGIQLFVLIPALQGSSSVLEAAVRGGLLGFFAYSTFELTGLALFKNWSVAIVVIDIVWGTLLTGATAATVLWLARVLLKIG